MKKSLNILLIVSFVIALAITIWLNYVSNNQVGNIKFDSKVDNIDFKTCSENVKTQYYNVGTNYEGGAKAFRKEIFVILKKEQISFDNKSGYITFRFVVNCKGEIGRFRVNMIDKNIKETKFDISKLNELKTVLKTLKKWNPGEAKRNNLKTDSYYNIKFKIEEGEIIDIF